MEEEIDFMNPAFTIGDQVEMTPEALGLKLHKQHKWKGRPVSTATVINFRRDLGTVTVSLHGCDQVQIYHEKFWTKACCVSDVMGVKDT